MNYQELAKELHEQAQANSADTYLSNLLMRAFEAVVELEAAAISAGKAALIQTKALNRVSTFGMDLALLQDQDIPVNAGRMGRQILNVIHGDEA
jgi:hypothetical protein